MLLRYLRYCCIVEGPHSVFLYNYIYIYIYLLLLSGSMFYWDLPLQRQDSLYRLRTDARPKLYDLEEKSAAVYFEEDCKKGIVSLFNSSPLKVCYDIMA